jgi:predicted O-methyltransferase YrrM
VFHTETSNLVFVSEKAISKNQKEILMSIFITRALTLFFLWGVFILSDSIYAERSSPDLPDPYNNIELLPFDGHGWYSNANQISQLINAHHVKTVVEVGSWMGLSTRHIASILPEGGKVYAVDHWLGSEEHKYHPTLSQLYQQFLSNVIHAGLTNKIIPIRMDSLAAASHLTAILTNPPDLIYIDAGHDTKSVYDDLCAYYPLVQENGILCGDDWGWKSVQIAVRRFAKKNHLKIHASGNFWCLTDR